MRRIIRWLAVLATIPVGGFKLAPNRPGVFKGTPFSTANGATASSALTTFVAAIRDIHFAFLPAGDIGPLDAAWVRLEIGGLIAMPTLNVHVMGRS